MCTYVPSECRSESRRFTPDNAYAVTAGPMSIKGSKFRSWYSVLQDAGQIELIYRYATESTQTLHVICFLFPRANTARLNIAENSMRDVGIVFIN